MISFLCDAQECTTQSFRAFVARSHRSVQAMGMLAIFAGRISESTASTRKTDPREFPSIGERFWHATKITPLSILTWHEAALMTSIRDRPNKPRRETNRRLINKKEGPHADSVSSFFSGLTQVTCERMGWVGAGGAMGRSGGRWRWVAVSSVEMKD